jgi:hypothetical protein
LQQAGHLGSSSADGRTKDLPDDDMIHRFHPK